jgi:hypothetical protein
MLCRELYRILIQVLIVLGIDAGLRGHEAARSRCGEGVYRLMRGSAFESLLLGNPTGRTCHSRRLCVSPLIGSGDRL